MDDQTPEISLSEVRRTIEPFYEGQKLHTGESVIAHAEGVVIFFEDQRRQGLLAAAYLYYAGDR